MVNTRHRRSLSEGNKQEKWLDHQPKNMAPLGTAFVPAGLDKVRRKSVTKLDKDEVARCSRYSLTHQEEDTDGDVETHIYKVGVRLTQILCFSPYEPLSSAAFLDQPCSFAAFLWVFDLCSARSVLDSHL